MANQESFKHHFVPKLLLRPWANQLGELQGYCWDARQDRLARKRRGVKSFCWQLELLTLRSYGLKRDALESVFFRDIDNKGAVARDSLLESGPTVLTSDQRCDFARLLLSLDARRPSTVASFRDGQRELADSLDTDPDVLTALADEGLHETPSAFYEQKTGVFLEDRALLQIQGLVDNPKVGGRLINALWHVVRIKPDDESLILSDRPLIRRGAYDHPGATWVLPLTPQAAFVAVNHAANLEQIRRATATRFAKNINVESARQAERRVFSADSRHERWIGKYLSKSSPQVLKN